MLAHVERYISTQTEEQRQAQKVLQLMETVATELDQQSHIRFPKIYRGVEC